MASAEKICSESFAYTPGPFDYVHEDVPGCTNLSAVMNLTNYSNTPFDSIGYRQAKTDCTDRDSKWKKTLDFTASLPVWPVQNSKLFPVRDFTNDAFPTQPVPEMGINEYRDVVRSWPPQAMKLRPYGPDGPTDMRYATVDPSVQRTAPYHTQMQEEHDAEQMMKAGKEDPSLSSKLRDTLKDFRHMQDGGGSSFHYAGIVIGASVVSVFMVIVVAWGLSLRKKA